jgi:stage III sporulation protein AB
MIFRVAAALIFTAIGGVIGYSLADRLREAKRICGGIGQLFHKAEYYICRRGDDVYTFCRKLKEDKHLACLGFVKLLPDEYRFGADFHKQWQEAVENGFQGNTEELGLILQLGEILGRSDAAAQLKSIHNLERELEAIENLRNDALLKKGRLYRGTGLLFGVMAGILVL